DLGWDRRPAFDSDQGRVQGELLNVAAEAEKRPIAARFQSECQAGVERDNRPIGRGIDLRREVARFRLPAGVADREQDERRRRGVLGDVMEYGQGGYPRGSSRITPDLGIRHGSSVMNPIRTGASSPRRAAASTA